MADKSDMGGYASWANDDLDRRIDERAKAIVADALVVLAKHWRDPNVPLMLVAINKTIDELRQPAPPCCLDGGYGQAAATPCRDDCPRRPAPASETRVPEALRGVTVGPAAPQPTLAERLRAAGYNEYVNPDEANELMEEAADAFDAADREHEENERLREMVKEAWRVGSELRAENEALRERYARLDAAVMLYLEAHDRPWLEPSWSVTVHERRRVLASVRKELAEEAPDAE